MNKLEINQKIASIKAKNEFWKQFNDGSYELSCSNDGLPELCKLAREMEKDELFDNGEYAEYIMDHHHGDRIICNGDDLINLMEEHYLWDDFLESKGIYA